MRRLVRAALTALVFCGSMVHAQDIPPELRNWQAWVLKGEEFRRCPFLASANLQPDQPIDAGAFRCAWPERLTLAVDARGGSFTQRWQVYAETWLGLPGNLEYWPQDVLGYTRGLTVIATDEDEARHYSLEFLRTIEAPGVQFRIETVRPGADELGYDVVRPRARGVVGFASGRAFFGRG